MQNFPVRTTAVLLLAPVLLLAGCSTLPEGPSVMALPGAGKTFDQFRADDANCRQYAQTQVGGRSADQAAVDSGVRSAAIGTVVGAIAGAAIGGRNGAGVGAGTGLIFGSAAGAGEAQRSAYGTQRAYDHAYIQCMYANGEQVPAGNATAMARRSPPAANYPPPPPPARNAPPAVSMPPPPPGNPPPPPPGA